MAPAISALVGGVVMSGCGNGGGAESASELNFEAVMPDTLIEPEPQPAEEVQPVLTTTDDIMRYMNESADSARYHRGILPQMAEDVPEYAAKLVLSDAEGFLIVDKNTMKLYRYDRFGVEQERVGVAVAKPYGSKHKRRDNRTPEGYFTIEGIYDSTEWLYTDDDGNTSEVKGQFGPRFMRLRTPVSSQIGIHGTVAPWSIGGRRSHGCIRMTNENILRFAEICKPGWPVIVSPGPRDMQVNEEEGYDIPSVAVVRGRPRCKALAPAVAKEDAAPTHEAVSSEDTRDAEEHDTERNAHEATPSVSAQPAGNHGTDTLPASEPEADEQLFE